MIIFDGPMLTSRISGCSRCIQPEGKLPVLVKRLKIIIDWRAVCGRTARTVRREGWRKPMRHSYPYPAPFYSVAEICSSSRLALLVVFRSPRPFFLRKKALGQRSVALHHQSSRQASSASACHADCCDVREWMGFFRSAFEACFFGRPRKTKL